jgi:hypothetical protein
MSVPRLFRQRRHTPANSGISLSKSYERDDEDVRARRAGEWSGEGWARRHWRRSIKDRRKEIANYSKFLFRKCKFFQRFSLAALSVFKDLHGENEDIFVSKFFRLGQSVIAIGFFGL